MNNNFIIAFPDDDNDILHKLIDIIIVHQRRKIKFTEITFHIYGGDKMFSISLFDITIIIVINLLQPISK